MNIFKRLSKKTKIIISLVLILILSIILFFIERWEDNNTPNSTVSESFITYI